MQVIQSELTGWIDVVGKKEIQFSDWDVDVVWVDAESRMKAVWRLFKPLTVGALQWNCLEQDDLNQVQTPDLEENISRIKE